MTDYETDFAAWADGQAEALRAHSTNELDWDNLAEEIQDLAGRYRDEIESRLIVILEHLLKLAYIPNPNPRRGWRRTIIEQRRRITRVVRKNPSLRGYPATVLSETYEDARVVVVEDVASLPEECPWTIDQVRDENFWPTCAYPKAQV